LYGQRLRCRYGDGIIVVVSLYTYASTLAGSGPLVIDIADTPLISLGKSGHPKTLVIGLRYSRSLERVLHLDLDVPSAARNRHFRNHRKQLSHRTSGVVHAPGQSEGGGAIAQRSHIGRILA
jgi:hypothetical protein